MKKLILFTLGFLLLFCLDSSAQETKQVTLNFNASDFSLCYTDHNEAEITSNVHNLSFSGDTLQPAIPYIIIKLAVPQDKKYSSLSLTEQKSLFAENVVLARNAKYLPTNTMYFEQFSMPANYPNEIYPASKVEYLSTACLGDYNVLYLKVIPFEYNSSVQRLQICNQINITVNLEPNNAIRTLRKNEDMNAYLKKSAVNKEEINIQKKDKIGPTIDYIIITKDSLKQAFMPLVNWKKTKGLVAKVVTTEEIENLYHSGTSQWKIKTYIYNNFQTRSLKYVLLGGDDVIVPTQSCYVQYVSHIEQNMPCDLYYACFDGDFGWDANGNGIYGELNDNVDFTPSVYVTRAPVRTSQHVTNFINKIIQYESNPSQNGWNNDFLLCGVKLKNDYTVNGRTVSDAELKCEDFYNNTIATAPNWLGTKKCFYDTRTDFANDAQYDVNIQNINEQLSHGYTFVEMVTHGWTDRWATEEGYAPYTNANVTSVISNKPTIITTIACHSNGFDDSSTPSLSEAFIRSPFNQIVAYLGCSRSGWFNSSNYATGPSIEYDKAFYTNLFTTTGEHKNFGKIVALAKFDRAPSCTTYSNPNRWIQFGLNPIGDPEMPIFTQQPLAFDNASVTIQGSDVVVTPGLDDCTICAMSTNDYGETYYSVKYNQHFGSVSFDNINTDITICITRPNRIPYVANVGVTNIQNQTITGNNTITNDIVKIGNNVDPNSASGPAILLGGDINITGKSIVIEEGTILVNQNNKKIKLINQ